MKVVWCDTETTGLKPEDSAPFQIAMIYTNIYKVPGHKEPKRFFLEKVFYLNPLNDVVKYHEEAGKVHGYSEDTIKSYRKPQEVIPEIIEFLDGCKLDFSNKEDSDKSLPFFVGYNGGFDFDHLTKLFSDYGFDFPVHFQKTKGDVFAQVKKAGYMKVLPYLPDRKLTTVAKHLGVDLTNAHDALGDIRATREVATILQKSGVDLF